jgi:hypothetical protein
MSGACVFISQYVFRASRLTTGANSLQTFLCFVDRASLYNLVHKANLVHNLFLVCLSVSTCFGRLRAHHQEKQLCLCDTSYLLFCVSDCYAGWNTRQSFIQNNKYQVSHKHRCFSWWWAHSRLKHEEIDKYTRNKLYTKLVLFTRVYRHFDFVLMRPYLEQN